MSDLIIRWLGHACFMLECEERTAVIDPYNSVPGYPELHCEAGEVYASHTQHDDHGYFEAVKIVSQPGKSPFKVSTVDTFHDDQGGELRGKNRITIFEAAGMRVAHFGDLGHLLTEEQAEAVNGVDIALIPVGGFYTIDGPQAAEIIKTIGARVTVPMHFRRGDKGFDVIAEPEAFTSELPEYRCIESEDGVLKIIDGVIYTMSDGDYAAVKPEEGKTVIVPNLK